MWWVLRFFVGRADRRAAASFSTCWTSVSRRESDLPRRFLTPRRAGPSGQHGGRVLGRGCWMTGGGYAAVAAAVYRRFARQIRLHPRQRVRLAIQEEVRREFERPPPANEATRARAMARSLVALTWLRRASANPKSTEGRSCTSSWGSATPWCDGERLSRSSRKRRGSARRRGRGRRSWSSCARHTDRSRISSAFGVSPANTGRRNSAREAPARGGVAREGARHASARISALELTRHGRKLDFALAPRARFSGAGSPASSPAEMVNFKLARGPNSLMGVAATPEARDGAYVNKQTLRAHEQGAVPLRVVPLEKLPECGAPRDVALLHPECALALASESSGSPGLLPAVLLTLEAGSDYVLRAAGHAAVPPGCLALDEEMRYNVHVAEEQTAAFKTFAPTNDERRPLWGVDLEVRLLRAGRATTNPARGENRDERREDDGVGNGDDDDDDDDDDGDDSISDSASDSISDSASDSASDSISDSASDSISDSASTLVAVSATTAAAVPSSSVTVDGAAPPLAAPIVSPVGGSPWANSSRRRTPRPAFAFESASPASTSYPPPRPLSPSATIVSAASSTRARRCFSTPRATIDPGRRWGARARHRFAFSSGRGRRGGGGGGGGGGDGDGDHKRRGGVSRAQISPQAVHRADAGDSRRRRRAPRAVENASSGRRRADRSLGRDRRSRTKRRSRTRSRTSDFRPRTRDFRPRTRDSRTRTENGRAARRRDGGRGRGLRRFRPRVGVVGG